MATLHNALPKNNDEQLIVDIDLAILGTRPGIYKQFEQWVRKEYKLVPRFIYVKKRKEILTGFLKRERIFSHDFFHQKLEALARANISNAIRTL